MKKMVKKKISKSLSMAGWDLLKYLKDRRKGVIAVIAATIAYGISDNELSALIAGIVFEGIVSIVEFYLKNVELEK